MPTLTTEPTLTPMEPLPTGTSDPAPTHLDGLNPRTFALANGQPRVPTLVGLPEDEAQRVISAVGLRTTYANHQRPGDVPAAALSSVPVGHVLSQRPQPGTVVPRGTIVYLAVRKA